MKNSLERRILSFSLLALILTVAINTGFNVDTFRRSYRDSILQRAQAFASAFKNQIEAVINLGLSLDEIPGISEVCQETVDKDPEISYCLIEDASGKALYFNQSGISGETSYKYVGSLSPQIAILESEHLGKIYDYSLPLYDYDDYVVGRVRLGFSDSVLKKLVLNHLASTVLVLAVAILLAFGVVILFVRYDIVAPVKRLCGMAEQLASGKFDTEVPDMKTGELAILGNTLSEMARSLRDRDAELSRNYDQLEQTNLELQKSYEYLESVSSELGRSREMYRALLDEASDAILVCDDSDMIVIANQAAEKFFGFPKFKMENSNYFSFLDSIKCRDVENQFDKHHSIISGVSAESEIRFWRSTDERSLVGRASIAAIIDKDKRKFVQIIIRDATHQEEVRKNLEKTAHEMERLNQMKNSFLGLASHELKTPLTIIMGYTELLLTEKKNLLDNDTLDLIGHIAKASERLAEIIRDMVDVAMIDGRTIDLVSQVFDINLLVQRAVDIAEPFAHQRAQTLALNLADDLPSVKCDGERIVQAIGNVLNNAIKFTPDKGKIFIQTKLVNRPRSPERFASAMDENTCKLSDQPAPYVEIAIIDRGIGIAEAEQEHIFDKFYEVGDVTEHSTGKFGFKSRGAGLGLSIVKGIVDLHGGAVWVESLGHDPDTMPGSVFYILLPASESTA